jgi:outer membrane murein-binding lipoprotein Lpp
MTRIRLNRNQLAAFLPDDDSIRKVEALFTQATDLTPAQIAALTLAVQEASLDAGTADAKATQANDALDRIADSLELLAYAPPRLPVALPDDVAPPITPPKRSRFGSFYDTTNQTAAVINTAYAVTFNTTDLSEGVYRGSPTSRIFVDEPGVYNFQFSAQLDKTAGGIGIFDFWIRVNGANIANSTGRVRIQGNNAELITAWNFLTRMKAGDYFELMWSVDDTSCQITAFPAAAPHPGIPSVILTVSNNIGA